MSNLSVKVSMSFLAIALFSTSAYCQTVATPPGQGFLLSTVKQSIGVDANLDDTSGLDPNDNSGGYGLYGNESVVESALNYLGITQVRSGLPNNPTTNFQSYVQASTEEILSTRNYKFALVFSDYAGGITEQKTFVDQLFAGVGGEYNGPAMKAGSVSIVEGLNEINNQNPAPTLSQATEWQRQLLCLTRPAAFCAAGSTDPNLIGSAVASFTSNGPVIPTANASVSFPADFANSHPYVEPSNNYLMSVLNTIQAADQSVYGFDAGQYGSIRGTPLSTPQGISTESGAYYEPANSSRNDLQYLNGFDAPTMAIKDLDSILDHASSGQISYLYQLFNNYESLDNAAVIVDSDNRYGLFTATGNRDGNNKPTYTPTPAATAIHNFTVIAYSNGLDNPVSNNCLIHTISGLPSGASSLMVKSNDNNDYRIVLWWDNPNDWDKNFHKAVAVTPRNVTINFRDAVVDSLYDPVQSSNPINGGSATPVYAINVQLADDPIIVGVHVLNGAERCG